MFNNSRPFLRELYSCVPRLKGYPGVISESRLTPKHPPPKTSSTLGERGFGEGQREGKRERETRSFQRGKKAEFKQKIKNPIALYFSATPKTRRLKKKQLLSLQYPGKLPMRGQNKDIFQHARSQKNWPHLHPFLGSPRHVYNQNKGANQDVGSWKQMTPERRPQNNGKSKSQDDSGAANQKRSRRDFKTESTEYLRCLNILRGNFYDWGRV